MRCPAPAPVDALMGAFAEPAGAGGHGIAARSAAIERLFAGERVEDIVAGSMPRRRPASADAPWAGAVAATIRSKAPLSLKLALAQVRRGRDWSFGDCMRAEWRIVSRVAYGEDFYEGIRAVIIDKDNRPRWRPASLAEVTQAEVDRHFARSGRRACIAMSDPRADDAIENIRPAPSRCSIGPASTGPAASPCSCGSWPAFP